MQKLYVEAREFEYRGLTEDRRGIIIPLGIVWTFPSLRTIKTDAYARPVDGLESYAPKHIKRITFEYPDLTKEFPGPVKEAFERKQRYYRRVNFEEHVKTYPDDRMFSADEFEQSRQRIVAQTLEEFSRSPAAKRAVWQEHGTDEIAAEHGYQGFAFKLKMQESLTQLGYSNEAAVEEIDRLKYVVRYDDPDETAIYLKGIKEEYSGANSKTLHVAESEALIAKGKLRYLPGFNDVWVNEEHFDLRQRAKARLCIKYLVEQAAFAKEAARHLEREIDPYVRDKCGLPPAPHSEVKIHHYFTDKKGKLEKLCKGLIHSAGRNGKYYLKID